MNRITLVNLILAAQSETSSATWAVLMTLVGFIAAGVIAAWRMYAMKLDSEKKRADANEEKASDARHAQIITKIDGVKESVDGVASRMDKVEARVGHLELGHERLENQLQNIQRGGES